MLTHVPQRIAAAIELLSGQPGDHVLEIGCGNGTAAALASERNRAHLESGKLSLYGMALESAALGEMQFDKIFAINVNCFWLDFEEPLEVVKRLLKSDGTFFIFYQQPTTAKMRDISLLLRDNLVQAGFVIKQEIITEPDYCLISSLSE
ncbi:MAG: hypothetical protein HC875_20380 [Anaerolineales bacterium]|nr:hypothetical protein [Anaerolineales bacterium]